MTAASRVKRWLRAKAGKVVRVLLPARAWRRLKRMVDRREPIWDWIRTHDVRTVMEVGLGSGENAERMIELAPGCHYYCFDDLSWKGFHESMIEVYERIRRMPNTHFFIGDSMETLPRVVDSLPKMDVIFIDGFHLPPFPASDWNNAKKLMRDGSVCFFHDYDKEGVKQAVDGIDREKYKVEMIRTKDDLYVRVQKKKKEKKEVVA